MFDRNRLVTMQAIILGISWDKSQSYATAVNLPQWGLLRKFWVQGGPEAPWDTQKIFQLQQ